MSEGIVLDLEILPSRSREAQDAVLAHEIQHAIQDIEGFARGGNMSTRNTRFEEAIRKREELKQNPEVQEGLKEIGELQEKYGRFWALDHEYEKEYKKLEEDLRKRNAAYKEYSDYLNSREYNDPYNLSAEVFYARLGGEVESRNVEKRMNMTPEERRNSLASETEDVAREDQIFLNEALGTASENGRKNSKRESVEETDARFNEELQQQIDGTQEEGHVYQLGLPSRSLLSTGIPELPIQLTAQRLYDKATKFDHDFDLEDVKGLVKAIQEPIAIFAYGNKNKWLKSKSRCTGKRESVKFAV